MKNLYFLLLFATGFAGAQIVNIPDANFKNKLIALGIDTNADGEIQQAEAESVTDALNISNSYISDLTGISAFANMQYLRCGSNLFGTLAIADMPNLKSIECNNSQGLYEIDATNLPALDSLKCNTTSMTDLNVSGINNLKYLDCGLSHLSALNLANMPNLTTLICSSNGLGFIDLALVPNLEYLDCSGQGMAGLNFAAVPNLKSLDCSNNSFTTLSISNMPNLVHLNCGNNQMTSLNLSNLPALQLLVCGGNFLTSLDLSAFTALTSISADGNHFTLLNVSGLTNLFELSCALTQLPALNVTGLTSLNYLNCAGNNITSLDLSNLPNLQDVTCGNANMTSVNISNSPAIQLFDCQNSSLTSLDLTGHAAITKLYCGFNPGLSNLDFSAVPNLTLLSCRSNNRTTLDVSMLPNLFALYCDNNQLTTLDCSNNHMLTWLFFFANNLETLFIKNGMNENFDSANWIENPNLQYVCADESQIASIQAATGLGVAVNSYCTFNPGGDHNTITGTIRFDADNNGCDAADLTPPFIKVNINDGVAQGSTFTTTDSSYHFYTGTGNETITPDLENPAFFNISPSNAVINFPIIDNSVVNQDFCLTANGAHNDLEVVIAPVVPARPGFDAVYKIVYRNKGNTTMGLPLGIMLTYNPNLMTFVQADVAPSLQNANSINWDYANLNPFESRVITAIFHINSPGDTLPVNVGDALTLTSVISPNNLDETIPDNTFVLNQTVVGSYDPNALRCLEGDVVAPSEIGNYLHYMATFENTGTDVAQNIVVTTTIDATQFDLGSLRILNSSDPAEVRVMGNKAEYIFRDINLAIGGHGNILLKIKTDSGLVSGDTVTNKADIYFDYNLPVATNEANTIFQILGVGEHDLDNSIAVYPNPAHSIINIQAATDIKSVQLYDIQGRLLQMSLRNEPNVTMDISDKQSGVYFLKITSDKGMKTQKIIKD